MARPFSLSEYVTLEILNDDRMRAQQMAGRRRAFSWNDYIGPFAQRYGRTPTRRQLWNFAKNMNANPAFYQNMGYCDIPPGQFTEAYWQQFEWEMNAQGYFNPYYQ
jgi:hypothetical protein